MGRNITVIAIILIIILLAIYLIWLRGRYVAGWCDNFNNLPTQAKPVECR